MTCKIKKYQKTIELLLHKHEEIRYRKKIVKQLENKNFTIISNNCWGGGVYETLGLEYNTPTVGLFFYASCYTAFIKDLKENLSKPITFIDHSKYDEANRVRMNNPYPIGTINDNIEIHFLHYSSLNEASEKWERRKKRINYDNLYFSLTDNDQCTIKEIKYFDSLPYKKVFFSSKKIDGIDSLVWLKQFKEKGKVGDLYSNPWLYRKYFNIVKWLNS